MRPAACSAGVGARLALSQPLGQSVWLPSSDTTNGGVSPRARTGGPGLMGCTGVSLPRARSEQAEKVQDGFSVKT